MSNWQQMKFAIYFKSNVQRGTCATEYVQEASHEMYIQRVSFASVTIESASRAQAIMHVSVELFDERSENQRLNMIQRI